MLDDKDTFSTANSQIDYIRTLAGYSIWFPGEFTLVQLGTNIIYYQQQIDAELRELGLLP